MNAKIIIDNNPDPEIYQEKVVRELLNEPNTQHPCQLMRVKDNDQIYYVWAISAEDYTSLNPLFKNDKLPSLFDRYKTEIIAPNTFFYKAPNVYYIYKQKNGMLEVGEIDIFSGWEEILTMAKALGINNPQGHIARAYLLNEDKHNARKLIGHCWRVYNDSLIGTLPLFRDDFRKIIQYSQRELDFEEMDINENILHNNILWKVQQNEEKKFFILNSSLRLL